MLGRPCSIVVPTSASPALLAAVSSAYFPMTAPSRAARTSSSTAGDSMVEGICQRGNGRQARVGLAFHFSLGLCQTHHFHPPDVCNGPHRLSKNLATTSPREPVDEDHVLERCDAPDPLADKQLDFRGNAVGWRRTQSQGNGKGSVQSRRSVLSLSPPPRVTNTICPSLPFSYLP